MLQVANISEFRKNLKSFIDSVAEKNNTLIVNSNGKSVVVISLDDFNKMDETQYLTSTRANKKRLDSAIKSFKKGRGSERKLISS